MCKNKIFCCLLALLAVSFNAIYAQTTVGFEQALQQKIIETQAIGNDRSCHYLKPLLLTIKNTQNTPKKIWLKAGTYFTSTPSSYQDITVMKDQVIALNPLEELQVEVAGVCTEPSNSSPSSQASYALAKIPDARYASLAKFVNQEKLYGTSEAQTAMWFLCQNQSPTAETLVNAIHGCSGNEVYLKLLQQLATMSNIKLDVSLLAKQGDKPKPNVNSNSTPTVAATRPAEPVLTIRQSEEKDRAGNVIGVWTRYYDGTRLVKEVLNGDALLGEKKYQVKVNGSKYSEYSFDLTRNKPEPFCEVSGSGFFTVGADPLNIRIGMFDKDHILVREIYYNENATKGTYKLEYAFDCEAYTDNLYYFKVIRNDQVTRVYTLMSR